LAQHARTDACVHSAHADTHTHTHSGVKTQTQIKVTMLISD